MAAMEGAGASPRVIEDGRLPIRVLIADDHEWVRVGLRRFLARDVTLEVVGEAWDTGEAVTLAERTAADVVLMDVRMPGGGGIQACREIRARRPDTHVLMLSVYVDDDALRASVEAGASGYLLKEVRGREIISAIRAARRHASPPCPQEVSCAASPAWPPDAPRARQAAPFTRLTGQERRILGWMAEGKTSCEIAEVAGLSVDAARSQAGSVLAKLNASV